jgi:hypothetical protein
MRIRCSATRFAYALVAAGIGVGVAAVQPALGQAPAQTFDVTSVKLTASSGRGVTVQFLPTAVSMRPIFPSGT